MKKYKYEFEAIDDFEKGDCCGCPFCYVDWNLESHCPLYKRLHKCPLVEVDEQAIAEWLLSKFRCSACDAEYCDEDFCLNYVKQTLQRGIPE